ATSPGEDVAGGQHIRRSRAEIVEGDHGNPLSAISLGFFVADARDALKGVSIMSTTTTQSTSILRLKDLQRRIPLSRSAIYAKISAGEFPPPIALGPRAIGWLASDVENWIQSRRVKAIAQEGAEQ